MKNPYRYVKVNTVNAKLDELIKKPIYDESKEALQKYEGEDLDMVLAAFERV
ncbi:hypothetical protein MASR2M70_16980 [Bacillota bacterium]